MTSSSFDIFAKELMPLRHGYPLWVPESHDDREVYLGDVGWLSDGGLHALFNCTENSDSPRNGRFGVPYDFERLEINSSHLSATSKYIAKPVVCSRSMRKIKVAGQIAANM